MRKTTLAILAAVLAVALAVPASAAPLPDNCTKDRGTVTCTTFEGPGKNQGGVGHVDSTETKGNTTNKNPEPQDLQDECGQQNPEKSKGKPIVCP